MRSPATAGECSGRGKKVGRPRVYVVGERESRREPPHTPCPGAASLLARAHAAGRGKPAPAPCRRGTGAAGGARGGAPIRCAPPRAPYLTSAAQTTPRRRPLTAPRRLPLR